MGINNIDIGMNDKNLIEKIIAEDHLAFKEFVGSYQLLVFNACYNLIGNIHDAEDVAQDVFFHVYKSAKNFRYESKLSTWLYKIAVNRSLNFIRDHKRFKWFKSISLLLDDNPEDVTNLSASKEDQPDAAFENKEQSIIVKRAIEKLPENQRAAFVLHKYEGLSYQETAEILQRSLSSVESLIHRAKLNLQKNLLHYLKKN